MVNKLNPKSMPNHNQTHKEFYEPKLEMMICGCGNRRLLTIDEQMKYGIIQSEDYSMKLYPLVKMKLRR